MKALQISSFGSPTDVVELAEIKPDDPGRLAVALDVSNRQAVEHAVAEAGVDLLVANDGVGHQNGATWEIEPISSTSERRWSRSAGEPRFAPYR